MALVNTLRTVLATRQPICFWWGPDLLQFHNDDYLPILKDRNRQVLGQPFADIWSDVWEDVEPIVGEALAGRGTWFEDLPLHLVRSGHPVETFWTFSYSPLFDDAGNVAGVMNIVRETTDAVRHREALADEVSRANSALSSLMEAEKRQRVLQRELTHRMKNTLAMVQSVVTQSLRHAHDVKDGARLASQRIDALARAQDALTDSNWEEADVGKVAEAAFLPHCDERGRVTLEGSSFPLSAQQALGLSLAIHELATNAVKHGALSCESGHVRFEWWLNEVGAPSFRWTETGGPPVVPPSRSGFGSRLTTRVVPSYFDGHASIDYRREGVVYVLEATTRSQTKP
ncbi:histidine kinase [Fulvimarina endophytica]|uniref:histidine kinase n=2 Tax=Fulvimarina endophytica TaxID=2293836 RepID=A0A371XBB2_9HYPH|nr:histidine kinase [Fulvimarina endophytica]